MSMLAEANHKSSKQIKRFMDEIGHKSQELEASKAKQDFTLMGDILRLNADTGNNNECGEHMRAGERLE